MLVLPSKRILRPSDKPAFEWTQRFGLDRDHWSTRDLVGCWMMNEGGGNTVYDLSGNKHHGTLLGDASWTTGKYGAGILIPGTPYGAADNECVVVPASTDFDFGGATGQMTIIVHARIDILDDNALMGRWEYSTGDFGFIYDGDIGADWMKLYVGPSFTVSVGGTTATGIRTAGAGLWWQFAVTKSGSAYAFYVNDRLIETDTDATTWTDNEDLVLGALYDDGNYAMNGAISHAVFYNRALSASEIASLHRNPFQMIWRPRIMIVVPAAEESPAGIPILRRRIEAA